MKLIVLAVFMCVQCTSTYVVEKAYETPAPLTEADHLKRSADEAYETPAPLTEADHLKRSADGAYETPAPLTEADHLKRDVGVMTNMTVSHREKRFLFIAEFLGGFFAEYALNLGIEALEGYLGKEDPMEKLQASIDQLTESIEKLQVDVNRIGKNILNLEIASAKSSFATTINHLHMLMSEEMDLLVKENPNDFEKSRQESAIGQILDRGSGIEIALRNLHLALIGKNNFPNKHIIETFYDKIMIGREQKPFKADSSLRSNIMLFMKYLLETQAIGFNVWYTAINTKYRHDSENLQFYQDDIKSKEKERLEEQKKYLAEKFFKPCSTISLPNYPNRPKSLSCSDGFNFGSVCHQRCAGSCQSQSHRYDKYWYPPLGFPAVQCLLKGQWSKNWKSETRVACTFCATESSKTRQPSIPYQCVKYDNWGRTVGCSATIKVNVGLDTGRRCQNGCHALRRKVKRYGSSGFMSSGKSSTVYSWKTWCYIEGKKWEYCLPEKFLRKPDDTQNGKTVRGETCKGDCNPGTWFQYKDWHWCDKKSGGWDYCS